MGRPLKEGEVDYVSSGNGENSKGDNDHGEVPQYVRQIMVWPTRQIIVAFGCTDTFGTFDTMLVRWSDLNKPGSWSLGDVGQAGLAGGTPLTTGSYIVGAAKSKREVLIWTDEAIYSMSDSGDTDTVFRFQELSTGISIVSPHAYSVAGDSIFWMDDRNFYMYNGSINVIPCSVLHYIFTGISGNMTYRQA